MIPANYDLIGTQMPWWLVISCRNRWYLENFVECGAGYGHTSAIACSHFQRVWSIELVPDVFAQQVPELQTAANAVRLCGPTTDHLVDVSRDAEGTTLWYLDSHWPGLGQKLGPECPILQEIEILRQRPNFNRDVVMIDNYGMFERKPRPPHDPTEWPSSNDIIDAFEGSGLRLTAIADVLCAAPSPLIFNF